MAVVFDNPVDRALRTSDLINKNAPYTVMGWFHPTAGSGTHTLFSMNDDGSNYDFMGLVSGLTVYLETQAGSQSFSAIPQNTWTHLAFVRSGPSLKTYINGVQDGLPFGDFPGGRPIETRVEVGGFTSANNNPFIGGSGLWRAFQAELSAPEIVDEMASPVAIRTANLYGDWRTPIGVNHLNDFSGNERHFTEVGTLTDMANPFGDESNIIPLVTSTYRRRRIS